MKMRNSDFDLLDDTSTVHPHAILARGAAARLPDDPQGDAATDQMSSGWWIAPAVAAGGAIWAVILF